MIVPVDELDDEEEIPLPPPSPSKKYVTKCNINILGYTLTRTYRAKSVAAPGSPKKKAVPVDQDEEESDVPPATKKYVMKTIKLYSTYQF